MPPSAHVALIGSIVASALGALIMCLLVARYGFTSAADDPGTAWRRLMLTRFGHAAAGVCFAATGIFTIVALADRPRPAPPMVASAVEPDRRVQAQIQALATELRAVAHRLEQGEARLGAVEGSARRLGDEVASATARSRQVERMLAAIPRRAAAPAPVPKAEPKEPDRDPLKEPAREPAREPAKEPQRWVPTAAQPGVPLPAPTAVPPPAPASPPGPPVATQPAEGAAAASPYIAPAPPVRLAPEPAASRLTHPPAPAREQGLAARLREEWSTVRRGLESVGDDLKTAVQDLARKVRGD